MNGEPAPAWEAKIREAADRAYRANPPTGPLAPETAARIRRILPPPPPQGGEQAA